jgi:hypothetical protein
MVNFVQKAAKSDKNGIGFRNWHGLGGGGIFRLLDC